MSNLRKAELICGIVTGSYALGFVIVMVSRSGEFPPLEVFVGLLLNEVPALIVMVGACIHTVKNKSGGKIMIWLGAILSAIVITLAVLGGLIGYYGIRFTLYFLIPYFLSIVTAAVTYVVVQSEKVNRAVN